jgi:hypothetical protein
VKRSVGSEPCGFCRAMLVMLVASIVVALVAWLV